MKSQESKPIGSDYRWRSLNKAARRQGRLVTTHESDEFNAVKTLSHKGLLITDNTFYSIQFKGLIFVILCPNYMVKFKNR